MSEPRTGPVLPQARGPLSRAVIEALANGTPVGTPPGDDVDPYGEDLHLALYVCYELHYRGFAGVDEDREWDPGLLGFRAGLEARFLRALRRDATRHARVDAALGELLVEPVRPTGVSAFLKGHGELWQAREYAALRSLYHLKEADPQAWVIPRLTGRSKAALVAVEFDEYGGGRAEQIHARLFADLMTDLGLSDAYGAYLDSAPAEMLATVNLMSVFGLHRALRGALVGHFAALEVTSPPISRRMAQALERLDAGPDAVRFYTEHVEADAVHEQLVRNEVIAGLLEAEPRLESDVAFGIDATGFLEDRLGERLLEVWRTGGSSLRVAL